MTMVLLLLDDRYDDYVQRGEWYHDEPLDDYPDDGEEDFTDDSEEDGEQFI